MVCTKMKFTPYLLCMQILLFSQLCMDSLAQTSDQPKPSHAVKSVSHPKKAVSAGNSKEENAYSDYLRRSIWEAWSSPRGHEPPPIIVFFKVDRNGNLNDLSIKKSSGDVDADNAALEAVKNVAPFKPLPTSTIDDATVQFTFWHRDSNEGVDINVTFLHH